MAGEDWVYETGRRQGKQLLEVPDAECWMEVWRRRACGYYVRLYWLEVKSCIGEVKKGGRWAWVQEDLELAVKYEKYRNVVEAFDGDKVTCYSLLIQLPCHPTSSDLLTLCTQARQILYCV